MSQPDRVAELEDLVAAQRRRIGDLELQVEMMAGEQADRIARVPVEWGLTGREARLLLFLAARGEATKGQIMTALYADRTDDPPEIKIVDVFVCKLRRKLKPFGIAILTLWGRGYALEPAARAAVRAAIADDEAEDA